HADLDAAGCTGGLSARLRTYAALIRAAERGVEHSDALTGELEGSALTVERVRDDLIDAAQAFIEEVRRVRPNPAMATKGGIGQALLSRQTRLDRITDLVNAAVEAGALDLDTGLAVHKELDRVAATLRSLARRHSVSLPQTAAGPSPASESERDTGTPPRGAVEHETAPSGSSRDLDLRRYSPVALSTKERRAA